MGFTNFLRDSLLDEVWGGSAYTPPTDIYVGLSTTLPNDGGTGITEPTGGYARVQVVNNLTNWPASVNGAKANGVDIEFPEATSSWGTVSHFFISDAASGGNILAWAALTTSKLVETGDTARFKIGDLDITLT